ncbi:glutathione S-transferase N-terminal domain-containing protein [Xanthobacter dioxanivorans]|uniref:Glutathione S-transferase N-terminal domain-containing protein n=1 Tax=Xanthobacter dioxanivorans TaxID=2528964 RepID=A0A974SFP0_9HYPH|nr:glutathione S-transferase N-terminal domain-containing protein [Xanthobacter dioxanivorans]QRG04481.1 glutathione S-transferase N-terminal domain-containing protein [Xanthobacter dioxanivorans]
MKLRHSPTSPFVRKVRLAAAVLGQALELEPADTLDPNDSLRQQNPLGKIPALLTEDGMVLFDSPVILAYLDQLAGGGRIIPTDPAARFAALRMEALADGMMDAGILRIYEGRFRPAERHEPKWLEHQAQKMERALDAFEAAPPVASGAIHVGDIALGSALGWFDFRFEGKWRADRPKLVAWFDDFVGRCPGFAETKPVG